MAAHVLVVATVTATSDDLMAALTERARRGSVPVDFMLVMPASGPDLDAMKPRLEEALERWREAGLKCEGLIGDSDPVNAVDEVCSPGSFDEVIVSTLPGQSSKWLRFDLPHRVATLTGAIVHHVIAMDMRPEPPHGPPPPHETSPLGPLGVLAWGGKR
jgi:hypothetical protein